MQYSFSPIMMVAQRARAMRHFHSAHDTVLQDGLDTIGSGVRITTSDAISDPFWNFGYGITPETYERRVPATIEFFQERGLKPAVMAFEDAVANRIREAHDVGLDVSDQWMVLHKDRYTGITPLNDFDSALTIRRVAGPAMAEDYAHVFRSVFMNEDADRSSYTSGYSDKYMTNIAANAVFHRGSTAYFVGYDRDEPVAISGYGYDDENAMAGLYHMGVVKSARGRDFARDIAHRSMQHAFACGAHNIMIQADRREAAAYERFGYEPVCQMQLLQIEV